MWRIWSFLGYANDSKVTIIWTTGPNGHGGSVKIRWDIHFHDPPDTSPEHIQPGISFDPLLVHNNCELALLNEERVDHNTSRFDFQNVYASLSLPHPFYIVAYSFPSDIHPSAVVPHHSSLPSSILGETNNSHILVYDSYVTSFPILSYHVLLSDSSLMSDTAVPLASGTTTRPKHNVWLQAKYFDYVDSDSLVQQLACFGRRTLCST